MNDDNNTKKIKDEASSVLENEGIVIETINARTELEEDLSVPQTKEAEKELFEAIGVEIHETPTVEIKPERSELEDNLNKEGIELLRTEPREEDGL